MPPSGDDEGITIANRLRETHPDIGVAVRSQFSDHRHGVALLEHSSDARVRGGVAAARERRGPTLCARLWSERPSALRIGVKGSCVAPARALRRSIDSSE